jgi:hypothetical protein
VKNDLWFSGLSSANLQMFFLNRLVGGFGKERLFYRRYVMFEKEVG